MCTLVKRFLFKIMLPDVGNPFLADTCRPKELLEIERIHLLDLNTAQRHGWRLRKRHAQFRTTGNEAIPPFLIEELEHRHQMGIALDLIKKDERVRLVAKRG